jgi:hypothetical protein
MIKPEDYNRDIAILKDKITELQEKLPSAHV